MKEREINVEMQAGTGLSSAVSFHRGESGIPLVMHIFNGLASSDMSDYEACTMEMVLPSSDVLKIPCEIDGDTVKATSTAEMTEEAGEAVAELVFSGEDTLIFSEPIKVTVTGTASGKAEKTGRMIDERFTMLDKAIAMADEAKEAYEKAISEYDARLQTVIAETRKAKAAYDKATEQINSLTAEINEKWLTARLDYEKATSQHKEAESLIKEAVAHGMTALSNRALDMARTAQRDAEEALKRVQTLEALEESMIKRGGLKSVDTTDNSKSESE